MAEHAYWLVLSNPQSRMTDRILRGEDEEHGTLEGRTQTEAAEILLLMSARGSLVAPYRAEDKRGEEGEQVRITLTAVGAVLMLLLLSRAFSTATMNEAVESRRAGNDANGCQSLGAQEGDALCTECSHVARHGERK